MTLGFFCRGWGDNRNENPAFLQGLPRTLLRVTADGIEHNVHVMYDILKSCLLVVNRFVYAQLPQKRLIPGGCCPNHIRSLPFRELDGKTAHASGRAVNQHLLAFFQSSSVE